MRHIQKGEPLQAFSNYVRHNHPNTWNDLPFEIRRETGEHILSEEQHGISGYTEKLINSTNKHIDQFRKRALFPELTFDWDNFVVDEHAVLYGADFKDAHIRTREYYENIIDPVHNDNTQRLFEYMTNGEIVPRNGLEENLRNKAAYTIDIFNLSHPSLNAERRDLILTIISLKRGDLPADEIRQILLPIASFPSVVEFFCEEHIFSIL